MANNLVLRIVSGLVLAAVALGCIIMGGMYINICLLTCFILMLLEWRKMNVGHKKSSLYYLGIAYLSLPMLYWIWFLFKFPTFKSHIMLVLLIVWVADIFAYFGGRFLKGPKLAPNISPNKTWSGAITGGVMAFVAAYTYIYSLQHSVSVRNMFWVVVIVVASVFGDLLESKIKRILNVKDSGTILPGHGGVCDRLDSFLLATYAYAALQHITSAFS